MAQIIALAAYRPAAVAAKREQDWLRALIVGGCALALIMAKTALPF